MILRRLAKRLLPKRLGEALFFYRLRLSALRVWLDDIANKKHSGPIPLRPPLLRYRVSGALGRELFLLVGRNCANDLKESLGLIGREMYPFGNILDFGCGCARTLRWFHDHPESCQFFGTDIDPQAIAWCRQSMSFGKFETNGPFPPLPFSAENMWSQYFRIRRYIERGLNNHQDLVVLEKLLRARFLDALVADCPMVTTDKPISSRVSLQ